MNALGPGIALFALLATVAGPALAEGFEDAMPTGPGVSERLAEIQQRIQEAVDYPAIARKRGVEGETTVAFELGATGHASNVAVAQSSGFPALDRAATRAVEEAAPLPFVYGRLEIPVRFELDAAD